MMGSRLLTKQRTYCDPSCQEDEIHNEGDEKDVQYR